MDKWSTLEPVRLHGAPSASPARPKLPSFSGNNNKLNILQPSTHSYQNRAQFIGVLPTALHIYLLSYFIAIADMPYYLRTCKSLARIGMGEKVWTARWKSLMGDREKDGETVLDEIESRWRGRSFGGRKSLGGGGDLGMVGSPIRTTFSPMASNIGARYAPAVLPVGSPTHVDVDLLDDEFGDFASAGISVGLARGEFDSFLGSGMIAQATLPTFSMNMTPMVPVTNSSFRPRPISTTSPSPAPSTSAVSLASTSPTPRQLFIRAYKLLLPLIKNHLSPTAPTPPHLVLSTLLPPKASSPTPTQQTQAQLLRLLHRFLHPSIMRFKDEQDYRQFGYVLRSVMDRFSSECLRGFEQADAPSTAMANVPGNKGKVERIGGPGGSRGAGDLAKMKECATADWVVYEQLYSSSQTGKATSSSAAFQHHQRSTVSAAVGLEHWMRPPTLEWEPGKVWIERREVFYDSDIGRGWDPALNFTSENELSFDPFLSFLAHILAHLSTDLSNAIAIFPAQPYQPSSSVLLSYVERLATDVLTEYVERLISLSRGKDSGRDQGEKDGGRRYLMAVPAAFQICWKIVEGVGTVIQPGKTNTTAGIIGRHEVENVLFRLFDPHLDEYLDEEVEAVKISFDNISKEWDGRTGTQLPIDPTASSDPDSTSTTFLTSSNPAQLKRNVLAKFTDVLLVPVTIVPRAVGMGALAVVGGVATGARVVGSGVATGARVVGSGVVTGVTTVGTGVVGGIGMLNPTKWGATPLPPRDEADGYVVYDGGNDADDGDNDDKEGAVGAWIDEQDDFAEEENAWGGGSNNRNRNSWKNKARGGDSLSIPPPFSPTRKTILIPSTNPAAGASTAHNDANATEANRLDLDLFLSLDVALEMVHSARDAMKRLETFFPPQSARFGKPAIVIRSSEQNAESWIRPDLHDLSKKPKPVVDRRFSLIPPEEPTPAPTSTPATTESVHWSVQGFPLPTGTKLRETIEEVFVLLLMALRERHLEPGFERAIAKMRVWSPASSVSNTGTITVTPLLSFFELVHMGDTIGSMIQLYFDRTLVPLLYSSAQPQHDLDFLSSVMREKKRFEHRLDELVAKGLNCVTDVIMSVVEYILVKESAGREYSADLPGGGKGKGDGDKVMDIELGVTRSCTKVIEFLEGCCRVVRGAASREVLEVFYAEVGGRLFSLVQKHIKRQIISPRGGFQLISDLNAYHSFVTAPSSSNGLNLKPSSQLYSDYAALKLLAHVYVVDASRDGDVRELATIVRDVGRYGGVFRPEDVYEFVQRRSDWKKIEKEVDKTMYNLSFREDCVVC